MLISIFLKARNLSSSSLYFLAFVLQFLLMMPFLAEENIPVPTKDILSWGFDEPSFDQDMPLWIDATDPSRSISATQARIMIRQIAAGFREAGLKSGETVCISSFNNVYYPVLVLGIIAMGGVFTGANPGYTPSELAHHLKISRTKIVICEPELLDTVLAGGKELGLSGDRVLVFNHHGQSTPGTHKPWWDLFSHGETDWVRFDDLNSAKTTTAMRLFSSGTSGLPKAVELSHYNFISEHTLVVAHKAPSWKVKRLAFMPLFHAAMVPMHHVSPLRGGFQSYIMRRFDVETFFESVQRYGITDFVTVPPPILSIIQSPLSKRYDLSSIRRVQAGGAPIDKALQVRFQALLPNNSNITQLWAMTETCCTASQFGPDESDDTGSVGRFIPNIDTKLVDDDGNDITAFGIRGELCVRGPTVVRGYFENPEANARDWDEDGFFHTGDVFYRDEKTRLWYIVDRKKELLKVRGFQVAPAEIEGVLLSHTLIRDAAVVGVYFHSRQSDLPLAFVVRNTGMSEKQLSEDDVKEWVRRKLIRYKWLEGGVRFVDAIPKTASGKIMKRLLREQIVQETTGRAKL